MSSSIKPRLRGVSHEVAFFIALAAGIWLVATATSGRAFAVTAIYVLTLAMMLGISASYHRGNWHPLVELRWKRADHAMIFVFIAGSYTPICVLGIGGDAGTRILILVWVGAVVGALRAVLWVRAPRVVATGLYVAVGWLMATYWADVSSALGSTLVKLLVAGGLLYTVGAVVYALRRPDPFPRWFGYHEVFHTCVIAACVCHFLLIAQLSHTSTSGAHSRNRVDGPQRIHLNVRS